MDITYSNPALPESEASQPFIKGMLDRMAMSFTKYGPLAEAYPDRVSAIESLEKRLAKYIATGNTEWLMDVANFAMIEYMRPAHREAHFRATDSQESPGRKWKGEIDPSARHNSPSRWVD
jgi:hypothetical protein